MSPKLLQLSALALFALAIVTFILGIRSQPSTPEHQNDDEITEAFVDVDNEVELSTDVIKSQTFSSDTVSDLKGAYIEADSISRLTPSLDIAPDMRAIAIPINELSGIGGFVNPGNFVDIIYVATQLDGQQQVTTQQILRNIRVLAFGNTFETQSVQQRAASTAVLEVPASSVAAIVKAVNQGQVTLALVGSEKDESELYETRNLLDDSQCLVLVREEGRNFVSKVPCSSVDESQGRYVQLNE